MAARMMIHNPSSFMSDALVRDTRKASVLRDAAMPDAPMSMPVQVIEASHGTLVPAAGSRPRGLISVLTQGFRRTARGR